jgi:hypothetical protein
MKIFVTAAAFLLVAGGAYAQSVSVRNLTPPGTFEVVNEGSEVSLSSRVQVQRLFNGAWQNEPTDLHLVRSCDSPQVPACVTLRRSERLRPPPWNGLSCASQCAESCRANIMLPPGTFRFLVASCSGDWSIVGPAFNMEPA